MAEKRKVSTIRLWELKGQSEKERGSLVRLQYTSILLALGGGNVRLSFYYELTIFFNKKRSYKCPRTTM